MSMLISDKHQCGLEQSEGFDPLDFIMSMFPIKCLTDDYEGVYDLQNEG